MPEAFKRIAVFARHRPGNKEIPETVKSLCQLLQDKKYDIYIEEETASHIKITNAATIKLDQLQQQCDLLIVVGGDGSMLKAARAAVNFEVPVLGINRGRLGFLTDVLPNEIETKIIDVLNGKYSIEERFLLEAHIHHKGKPQHHGDALNDIVLLPGDVAHMIEFEVLLDDEIVSSQRADGLIIATPTGSTAYALSGGGPILHPHLDAVVLVPMFPHTLSSRPIVVGANHEIKIMIDKSNEASPYLSWDGHARVVVAPGDYIHIKKKQQVLKLVHPLDYNYYETLRSKLGWYAK